jgi:hypothetical protein
MQQFEKVEKTVRVRVGVGQLAIDGQLILPLSVEEVNKSSVTLQ